MAPRRKVLKQTTKHLTKAEKEIMEETEAKMGELTPLDKKADDFLTDEAKEIYNELYELLKELPVANLDKHMISTFAQATATYRKATIELEKEGMVVITNAGSKINPWHRVQMDNYSIMNSLSSKLGLNIDSRLKILTPKENAKKDIDPMSDFYDD